MDIESQKTRPHSTCVDRCNFFNWHWGIGRIVPTLCIVLELVTILAIQLTIIRSDMATEVKVLLSIIGDTLLFIAVGLTILGTLRLQAELRNWLQAEVSQNAVANAQ